MMGPAGHGTPPVTVPRQRHSVASPAEPAAGWSGHEAIWRPIGVEKAAGVTSTAGIAPPPEQITAETHAKGSGLGVRHSPRDIEPEAIPNTVPDPFTWVGSLRMCPGSGGPPLPVDCTHTGEEQLAGVGRPERHAVQHRGPGGQVRRGDPRERVRRPSGDRVVHRGGHLALEDLGERPWLGF
jgi:hypothetical protein